MRINQQLGIARNILILIIAGGVTLVLVIVVMLSGGGDKPKETSQSKEVAAARSQFETDAVSLVTQFYEAYIGTPAADKKAQTAVVETYTTTKLLTKYQANTSKTDPIVCTQTTPKKIKVTSHKIDTSTDSPGVTVVVTESFATGSNRTVSVRVIDNNGQRVDSVSCSK